jgi:hypothetical protein
MEEVAMARPFSYPEVAALEVGRSVSLDYAVKLGDAKRKVKEYAKRSGRKFSVVGAPGCPVIVNRLPDPEPEVA